MLLRVLFKLLIVFNSLILFAQDGNRSVIGGGYSFNADAYKLDVEKRRLNQGTGSATRGSSMGWPSLKQMKAIREAEKKEAKSVYENYKRVRLLDTLKVQTDKSIEFFDHLVGKALDGQEYNTAIALIRECFTVLNGLISKRRDIEAITTYGELQLPIKTSIDIRTITSLANFHLPYLKSLTEANLLTEAKDYYQQHLTRSSPDTGVHRFDIAFAEVIHAEIIALQGDAKAAMNELNKILQDYQWIKASDFRMETGFVYFFSGEEAKGWKIISALIKEEEEEDEEEASLTYAYCLDKFKRYFLLKKRKPEEEIVYKELLNMKLNGYYKQQLQNRAKEKQESFAELLKPMAAKWWFKYIN